MQNMNLTTFSVLPNIPEKLKFLNTLANNVWWSWNAGAYSLFHRIDPALYAESKFGPIELLSRLGQKRLEELALDSSFLTHIQAVETQFNNEVLKSRNWKRYGEPFKCIAYFSMEFGLHESIHIYSGGLGILAGDHLKSASDLDLPVCGIGIMYREGYFEQELDKNGNQMESYPENDLHTLPVARQYDKNGSPIVISVPLPQGPMHAAVWRLDVGRVPLFLLDTNIPENPVELRHVTGRLYGGDKLNRLRQEILLGLGGLRALNAMGYETAVSHMNEGHAAFLGIERIARRMREGLSFHEAHEFVRRTSVFTTHTPVPAGNETFDTDLIYPHLKAIEEEGGVSADVALSLGNMPESLNPNELSMTILGLNCSSYNNGVSELHGIVERDMWHHLWPDYPAEEVPIGHVTNGVHVSTWVSTDNNALYGSVLGPDWAKHIITKSQAGKIDHIPDEELWRIHEKCKANLIQFVHEHIEHHVSRQNGHKPVSGNGKSVLNKNCLTIGFARRFATYKRAYLIFSDRERLKKILNNPNYPVQIIFSGKAHPADNEGKGVIKFVTEVAKDPDLCGRIVFIDNYNMEIARKLIRGVDVWLNTPRRPNEASGTSGMKACINGAIHVSTLDGWWPEGYSKNCGWAIGRNQNINDEAEQDYADAQSLYSILENEIVPAFYDHSTDEIPKKWISMMKESIKMSLIKFSSTRMVSNYYTDSYAPALETYDSLKADNFKLVKEAVAHRVKLLKSWSKITIDTPFTDRDISKNLVGDTFDVMVKVDLGQINPSDVKVELYCKEVNSHDKSHRGKAVEMEISEKHNNGVYIYKQQLTCSYTGVFGFSARIIPNGDEWKGLMPGHIIWANSQ